MHKFMNLPFDTCRNVSPLPWLRSLFVTAAFAIFLLLMHTSAWCSVPVTFASSHNYDVFGIQDFTTVEQAADHQTLNITIQNNQAVWYYITIAKTGSGPLGSNVPSYFALGPHQSRSFAKVRFNGNDRLAFFADATAPPAMWMMAFDVMFRAYTGGPMPTDASDFVLALLLRKYDKVLGLNGDAVSLTQAINGGDYLGAMAAIVNIGKEDVVQEAFKNSNLIKLPAKQSLEWLALAFNFAYVIDVPVETYIAYRHDDLFESLTFTGTALGSPSNLPMPPGLPLPLYNNAGYISDGFPADGTAFSPGQPFTKSWTISNIGTTTWGSGYRWTFDGGEQMGAPDSIPVPQVHPGGSWSPSVNLTAPNAFRSAPYRGYWRMQGPDNVKFGNRVYVEIKVPTPGGNVGTFVSEDSVAAADGAPGFQQHGTARYWQAATGVGDGGAMLWTYNNDPAHGTDDIGDWRPNLPASGTYEVYVFIPRLNATTTQAHYQIFHASGQTDVFVNQASYFDQWVSLGVYSFQAGSSGFLRLVDQTNEAYGKTKIGFDAARWDARGVNGDIGYGATEQTFFLDCFTRNGERGVVGSPINNAHAWGAAKPVTIQDFRGGTGGDGAIIDNQDTAHTTAYLVHGSIWNEYAGGGGPDSPLGRPLSDESDAKPSWSGLHGRESLFEGGTIENSVYGAYAVYGAIADKYNNMNGSGGALGFPVSDQSNAVPSPQGTQGQAQWFEGGAVFASSAGVQEVHGAIYSKYQSLNASASVLGYPSSDEMDALQSPQNSRGRLNRFEGGTLYYSYQYGGYPVSGVIKAKHDAAGGTAGYYGFPVGDPVSGPLGMQQDFEGGTIYADLGVTLKIAPNVVTAGTLASIGTVTISQAAPANGVAIALTTTDRKIADVPDAVHILPGATSVTFNVYAGNVTQSSTATVTAPGYGASADYTVNPQTLAVTAFTIRPGSVAGGDTATATATFNQPAPDGSSYLIVQSSDSKVVSTPLFRLIPQGASSLDVTLFSYTVAAQSPQTLTCWVLGPANPSKLTASITVTPSFTITSVTVAPTALTGGSAATGTVTLDAPAPAGGVSVNLASSDTTAATVPALIAVVAGSRSASFAVATSTVNAPHPVTIIASGSGSSQQATLTVYPALSPVSLTLNPAIVVGGGMVTGTLTVNRPVDGSGVTVAITSSNKSVAGDASVFLPAGATSGTFKVSTASVSAITQVSLSAALGGSTQVAALSVIPGAPNLTATATLTRSGADIVATISVTNSGNGSASNVMLNGAVLGTSASTSALPLTVGTIAAGSTRQVVLRFSGSAVAPGARTKLQLSGTYAGGSYDSTIKVQGP